MTFLGKSLVFSLAIATSVSSQAYPEAEIHGGDLLHLVDNLPSHALHSVLHLDPKFKDGIFERDRDAVQAIHSSNAPFMTQLLGVAGLELRKRDIGNSSVTEEPTSSPTNPPALSTPPVMSTPHVEQSVTPEDPSLYVPPNNPQPTSPGSNPRPAHSDPSTDPATSNDVLIPVDLPTTDAAGRSTVTRASLLAPASLTIDVPVTTTDAAGRPVTSTARAPAVALTTIDAAGRPSTLTTRASGPVSYATYTPIVSKLVLSTSTLPDGTVKVFTSYTVVDGSAAGNPTATPNAHGQDGDPLLQNGGGRVELAWCMMVLVGVVGYLLE